MQNVQHLFETLQKKNPNLAKDFRTDGAHNSKSFNYFYKKYA